MATRTWVGSKGNDWLAANAWSSASPGPNAAPIPGDVLTIDTGTVNISGDEARALGGTGIYDFVNVTLGADTAGSAPVMVLLEKAGLGTRFKFSTSGTAGYATIQSSGPAEINSTANLAATAGVFTLDASGGQIAITDQGSLSVTSSQTLVVQGQVSVEGAGLSFVAAGLNVADNALGTLVNSGTVTANGGTVYLGIGSTLSGTGTFIISLGGTVTLQASVPATQTFTFNGVDGELSIANVVTFQGIVTNFAAGDLIDLTGVASATSASLAADGTLTVMNGGATVATLTNIGGTTGTLLTASDGNGGTLLSYNTNTRASYEIKAGAIALGATTVQTTMVAPAGTPTAGQAITGVGVKIGIISTGFNTQGNALANAQAGYLPYNSGSNTVGVTVLQDATGTDEEGQAMAQLIYAVAPSAQLYYYTGFTSGGLATAVAALQAAGCNIIVDDLGDPGEPSFQIPTDPVTAPSVVAVQNALAAGVDYFTAAGNDTNAYLQTGFTPVATTLTLEPGLGTVMAEQFDNGTPYEGFTAVNGVTVTLNLQWTAPWANSTTGYNAPEALKMVVYNADMTAIIATSTQAKVGGYFIPEETINLGSAAFDRNFYIAVYEVGSTAPAQFIIKAPGTGSGSGLGGYFQDPLMGTGSGFLTGHKLIAGVNTVGAAAYKDTPAFGSSGWLEPFSDGGPGTLYYAPDGTPLATPTSAGKVDFTSVDGVNTTVSSGFAPFNGTSAATPDAAAVAALMLQANPNLTQAQVSSILNSTAQTFNLLPAQQGSGLINAQAAVAAAIALACFAEGTRIATPRGEVAVEHLAVGDSMLLASGGTRDVIWIGHRKVDCAGHPDPRAAWPIRIAAHAFAEHMPARDLYLSPDHAILAAGVLIAAKDLVNGATVVQVPVETISYWHIELDAHDVLLAEQLPVESFLENDNRFDFEGAVMALHPRFERGLGSVPCARLVRQGVEIEHVRLSLRERAALGGKARVA